MNIWKKNNYFVALYVMVIMTFLNIFSVRAEDGKIYYFISRQSVKAMEAYTGESGNGIFVRQKRIEKNDPSQKWILEKKGDGVVIKSLKYGKYLTLSNDIVTLSSKPEIWTVTPYKNVYIFIKKKEKLALNLMGAGQDDDNPIIGYPQDNTESCQWFLVSADDVSETELKSEILLQNATYDNRNKIYILPPLPSAAGDADRLRTFRRSDLHPSGLYIHKGEKIHLLLEGTNEIEIQVGPEHKYGNTIYLKSTEGNAEFISPADGMMYFRYIHYGFEKIVPSVATVKVTQGGEIVPFYVEGKTSYRDWLNSVRHNPGAPYIEMVGKRAMITVRADKYSESGESDPKLIFKVINDMIESYDDISGLKSNQDATDLPSPLRIHYVQDDFSRGEDLAGVYMYATDYMIGMPGDSIFDLLNPVNNYRKWSVWHETGHIYQQWDWAPGGLTEVTVNIYSLHIQKHLGQPSGLTENKGNNEKNVYVLAGNYINNKGRNFIDDTTFPGDISDWIKLVMFERLKSELGDDFYRKLHVYYRHHPLKYIKEHSDEVKLNEFAYRASLVSGYNLIDYFSQWGLYLTNDTKSRIKKLNLPTAPLLLNQLPDK